MAIISATNLRGYVEDAREDLQEAHQVACAPIFIPRPEINRTLMQLDELVAEITDIRRRLVGR